MLADGLLVAEESEFPNRRYGLGPGTAAANQALVNAAVCTILDKPILTTPASAPTDS